MTYELLTVCGLLCMLCGIGCWIAASIDNIRDDLNKWRNKPKTATKKTPTPPRRTWEEA